MLGFLVRLISLPVKFLFGKKHVKFLGDFRSPRRANLRLPVHTVVLPAAD